MIIFFILKSSPETNVSLESGEDNIIDFCVSRRFDCNAKLHLFSSKTAKNISNQD